MKYQYNIVKVNKDGVILGDENGITIPTKELPFFWTNLNEVGKLQDEEGEYINTIIWIDKINDKPIKITSVCILIDSNTGEQILQMNGSSTVWD